MPFERSAVNDLRSLTQTRRADETPVQRPRPLSFERMVANDRLPPITPQPPAMGPFAPTH